jgi:hypothetical protein
MLPSVFKPGDIIGYSGQGWISTIINLGSYGLPWNGLSHVGIVGWKSRGGGHLVFESTSLCDIPCEITGLRVKGVQAHTIEDSVREYRGKVWHYPLYRSLYNHEIGRLVASLTKAVGVPYDVKGAVRAGGVGLSALEALLRGQDLSLLFCSEFVAAMLACTGVFPTTNASRWSPNRLVRTLRRHGIIGPARRLK